MKLKGKQGIWKTLRKGTKLQIFLLHFEKVFTSHSNICSEIKVIFIHPMYFSKLYMYMFVLQRASGLNFEHDGSQ